MWTGLGYYSRATRLLQAAQKVVAEYDGLLPRDPKILEKDVPGIGPYTAGAITSIAYGVQTPLVHPCSDVSIILKNNARC